MIKKIIAWIYMILPVLGFLFGVVVNPLCVLFSFLFLALLYLICFIIYSIKRALDRKKVFAARDELNESFKVAGAPAFYECPYSDWRGAEDYDEDPAEEAVKFMSEMKKRFEEYIEAGGDPKKIKSVGDLR